MYVSKLGEVPDTLLFTCSPNAQMEVSSRLRAARRAFPLRQCTDGSVTPLTSSPLGFPTPLREFVNDHLPSYT